MIVSKRPETPKDQPFLQQLFLERLAQELPLDHVPPMMRDQLLEMQLRIRLAGIRTYPDASGEVILADGEPAGWIYSLEAQDEIRLIEIMVLDCFRGQGVGRTAISGLISLSNSAGKPIRLRVNVTNLRAFQLYERLGFRRTGGNEVQHEMELPARPVSL